MPKVGDHLITLNLLTPDITLTRMCQLTFASVVIYVWYISALLEVSIKHHDNVEK